VRRAIQVADPTSTANTAVCGAVGHLFGPYLRPGGVRGFAGPDAVFEVNAHFANDALSAAISVPRRGLMA
jgi:hypothetical protein